MFLTSKTLQTLEAGVAATWQQQQLHLQNLSNVSTPGYKAKGMVFEEVLEGTRPTGVFNAKIVEDITTINRLDGNNVDSDKESMELYKAYVQYSMLLNKVTGELGNYSHVLNANM